MTILGKAATAARLVLRGNWRMIRIQIRQRTAGFRIRLHGGRPFVYRDMGFPFTYQPDWPDSVDYFRMHDGDWWELRAIARWLEPGDLVFDVGSNLGLYAFAAAARIGPSGRAVAVDADAFIAGKLRESARLLGTAQVEPVHAAITREPGPVTFHVRADRHHTGGQSLKPTPEDRAACVPVEVPGRTLSGLASEMGVRRIPAFVKIDIEGAEAMALASTPTDWFGASGPLWIIEINPGALANFGSDPQSVTRHFPAEFFDRWLLPKDPILPEATTALRRFNPEAPLTDSRYYNFLAIPKSPDSRARAGRIRGFFPSD